MLFRLGRLEANAIGLAAFVARWAWQAVEPGVGVDAARGLACGEANVCDHSTLWGQAAVSHRPSLHGPLHPGGDTHLIQVLTVGAVAQEAHRAGATGPGAIWEAAALGPRKAGVGQAAICVG